MTKAAVKTDEEVAAQVQTGQTEAFGELVRRYQQKMLNYARKFVDDGEEAKDLTQEIFLKAYVNIQSFDVGRRFSPWLYRIAHNEFVNALKKRSKLVTLSFDFDLIFPHLASRERADQGIEQQELKQLLDKHLKQLSAKYKEPLVLYYFEELDYQEIAEVLQIPVSTVGVRLQRGRALLKKLIV